jgi:hypothetical protein
VLLSLRWVFFSKERATLKSPMLHELEPYLPELTPLMFCLALFVVGLFLLPGERAASRAAKEAQNKQHAERAGRDAT